MKPLAPIGEGLRVIHSAQQAAYLDVLPGLKAGACAAKLPVNNV